MPTACAAIEMRPPSRVESAILYPSLTSPSRLAARELRQVLLLLRVAAVVEDRVDGERDMRAEHHARRGARPIDFLDDQRVRHGVEAGASVFLRNVRAHEAERPHLAQQLRWDLALLVDLRRARKDFVGRAVARCALGELLLLGEREVEPGLRGGSDGLSAAKAQRRDATRLGARAQRVEERDEEARAGCTDGMTERDRTAVHVEFRFGDVELAADALDPAERLVHLEEIHVVD